MGWNSGDAELPVELLSLLRSGSKALECFCGVLFVWVFFFASSFKALWCKFICSLKGAGRELLHLFAGENEELWSMPWSTALRRKRKKLKEKKYKERKRTREEMPSEAVDMQLLPGWMSTATSLAVQLSSHGPSPQHPPWLCVCSTPLRSGAQGSAPHRQAALHSPPQLA